VQVLDGLDAPGLPLPSCVLTIGNFDGVHRAHQQLLAQAGLFAARAGGPVAVLTFEPHPLAIVRPTDVPPRLSLPEEKLRCLAEAGAELVVVARSEPSLLGLSAEAFVEEVIHRRFHPTHIVEGPSFGFGRGRKGTPELLRELAAVWGCHVHMLEPVTLQIEEGETLLVSSSLIRRLIGEGKVRRAGLCLGRPYALIGEVVAGDGRGRTIGFPTANLRVVEQLVPVEGVYAGRAVVERDVYAAAISVGAPATFGRNVPTLEAHLLDFHGELYGRRVRLEFQRYLRGMTKFESAEELARQIRLDVEAVREAVDLSSEPRSSTDPRQSCRG